MNVLSKGFWINVYPFKPITDLIFVLKSQRPLAQIATLGNLSLSVLPVAFVFRVTWIYRVRNELPVVSHKCVKMVKELGKSVQSSYNADIEKYEYCAEWLRVGIECVSNFGISTATLRHDLHSFFRNVYRGDIESSILNSQRMSSCTCTYVEYFTRATLYRDPIEFRKSVWIEELLCINRRIRDPIVTTEYAMGILVTI